MTYHHTIFYPAEEPLLNEATKARPRSGSLTTLPSAFLLPHATYSMIGEALHKSLIHAPQAKIDLVVFLGPLHQPILQSDEPAFLFTPEGTSFEQAGKTTLFHPTLLKELREHFPIHARQYYYEEEPAFELTLPFIHSYLSPTYLLPLIGRVEGTKAVTTLAKMMRLIAKCEPNVVFIISANVSDMLPAREAALAAHSLSRYLQGETVEPHLLHSCNQGALAALEHSEVVAGGWRIATRFLKGVEYPEIKEEGEGFMTWHLGAYKGE